MLKYKIPQIVTLTHVFYVYFAMCQKKNPCKVLIYRDFFVLQFFPAERRGFEPWVPGLPIHVISRTAPGDSDDDMPELNPSQSTTAFSARSAGVGEDRAKW